MQANSMIYSAENSLFTVRRVETVPTPSSRSQLVFQITCENVNPDQKIFLGLMETSDLSVSAKSPGIAVSIDPETGVIFDLVNNQGVIGYLDAAPLELGQAITLRIELEIIRHVYLPRLFIGEESFLHPALYLDKPRHLSGLAGSAVVANGKASFANHSFEVREMHAVA